MQKRCGKSKNAPNTHQNRKELYISRTHLEGIPNNQRSLKHEKKPLQHSSEMASQASARLESIGFHIIIILVVGFATKERTAYNDAPVLSEVNLCNWVYNQKSGIALVALRIKEQRVYLRQIFLLIALPCIYAVVLGMQNEASEVAQFEMRLCLDAEAASHVVVTVDKTVIVALCAAQQNSVYENSLFQTV